MGIPYAEVIGDPVAHSQSPAIHLFWLARLGLKADFRPLRLTPAQLPRYLAGRCSDPFWRGCSVTAPLKAGASQAVADPTGVCRRIGAANAIFRSPLGCGIGANTDLHGIGAALGRADAQAGPVCLIGSGGAARAVLEYLRPAKGIEVRLIARDLAGGRSLLRQFGAAGDAFGFQDAAAAIAGARLVANATPLGMAGRAGMPATVIESLARSDAAAVVFDMVYAPRETPLLRRAGELGRNRIDGLTMLIGQAAPAFELFFGAPAPRQHDGELRECLER